MKWNLTGKCFFITGTLIVALACGAGLASGWGGSSGSSGSSWGSSSSSWGGSGSSSGSSQSPTCVAANLNLSLTATDCHKCHTGDDTAIAALHHKIITPPPCTNCHSFTGTTLDPVQRDCISCHLPPQPPTSTFKPHGPTVHDKVTHCVVYDSCGNCHKESIPDIHSGAGSSGNRYSYHGGSYGDSSVNPGKSVCYLCHTSTNSTVQQTVVKGLAGQTVSCSNCHGGGR
ncbi:MAG: hypothetical protein GJV46_05460 [Geobacter sp.]|nr:hypothetical protein [Geobacter sp.]